MAFTKINAAGIGTTETVTVDGLTVINNGSFGGNLSVGGTLTYEDVTNVDSVGLITARSGISITGGDLTIPDAIIHSADTNTRIRFPTSDTFTVETAGSERLRIHSSGFVGIGTNTPNSYDSGGRTLVLDQGGTLAGMTIRASQQGGIYFADGLSGNEAYRGRIEYKHADDALDFGTSGTASKIRIDSSGRMLIGSTTSDDAAQMLKVARTSGTARLAIQAANDGSSQLDFADVADADIGRIQYDHNSDYMALFTNNSEALRIDSSGRLLLGTDTARAVGGESNPVLHIEGSGNTSNSWINITRFQSTTAGPNMQFAKARSNTPGTYTLVQSGDTLGTISFLGADGTDMANYAATIKAEVDGTAASNDMPGRLVFSTTADGGTTSTERLRIQSSGNVQIGTAANAGDALRYVDIGNYNTGSSAGSILRLLTVKSDGSSTTSADIVKYKTGGLVINNNEVLGTTGFISFGTGTAGGSVTERMRIDSAGNLLFNSGFGSATTVYGCRAWIQLNQGGSQSITGSGGVSSIADEGTGQTKITFTTTMPDDNYAMVGGAQQSGSAGVNYGFSLCMQSYTTTYSILIYRPSASSDTKEDNSKIHVAFFR